MAEYIDKEKLKAELQKKIELSHKARRAVEDIINDMPTANVEKVEHGCWIVIDHKEHLNVTCSNCKKDFYVYKKWQYRINFSNYCPNCGAKMDGKGGEQ